MGEMKDRYEEGNSLMKKLESMTPEKVKGWHKFTQSLKDGVLSEKVSHLIALAIGMTKGCEICIIYHTRAAIKAGATKQEILAAGWMAIQMDGGPGLAHMLSPVLKAIEEFTE